MTDREFDLLLEDAATLPPDDIVRAVTPWRRAMDHILVGSALCAVTVNVLRLNILLPVVGIVLQLLGFRSLRRENGWFRACWWLSVLHAALCLPSAVINATVWGGAYSAAVGGVLNAVGMAALVLLYLCLWRALLRVQAAAGEAEPHAGSAAALVVWYLALAALALTGYNGLLLGLIVVGCYVLILRSLYRLSEEVEGSGYALCPAPVRVSNGVLAKVIALVLILGVLCGYLFFSHLPMDWQAVPPQSAEAASVRAELLALGYPAAALDDLADEDVLACAGAVQLAVHERDMPVSRGRNVTEYEDGRPYTVTEYDVRELHFTDVAVRLPGAPERWRIFHHFRWTAGPGFRGTEALQIWPAWYRSEGWTASGALTGRVLCDRGGTTVTAPYHALQLQDYTAESVLWGSQSASAIFASFSLPRRAAEQRGYVAYGVEVVRPGYVINSWINYTYQRSPLQYPVRTAAEHSRATLWDSPAFLTVQNALQFWVIDGTIDMIE